MLGQNFGFKLLAFQLEHLAPYLTDKVLKKNAPSKVLLQFLHFKNKGRRPSFVSTCICIEEHTTKNDAKVEF